MIKTIYDYDMENLRKFILVQSKSKKTIELLIVILFSVVVPLISSSYAFNPFILPLLYLSYQRGINAYLTNVVIMTITAFIISIPYGIEMAIIQGVFFFFCIIFCLVKKNNFLKKYGAFVFTNLVFIILYLIRFFSAFNILNLGISFIISCFILYGYQALIRCIYETEIEFESRAKVIVLSTFSILFFGISGFYILITRFIHIVICKTSSFIEGALAIILNCIIIYFLQDASQTVLITLLFPGLISVVLNKKLSWFAYFISYLFISIYSIEKFYTSPFFYQGLLGILFALIIPDSFIKYITSLFTREESKLVLDMNNRLISTSEEISNIISYLDVVLDSSIDKNASPVEKSLVLIENKVCKECIKRDKCCLNSLLRSGLEKDFTKEERVKLFESCLFPYKILRHIRLNKTTLSNEKKYLEEIQNRNNAYRKEIENIYIPLRNVFHHSSVLIQKKTQIEEELKAYHYNVSNVSVYNNGVTFQIELKEKEELNKVALIISNLMNQTYYLEDMFFILSQNVYEVRLSSKSLFELQQGVISLGTNEEFNGDSYQIIEENNHVYLLLSDGIGHTKESSYLSMFLLKTLTSYRKIEKRIVEQINNANALLKSRVNEEMYATLDYIDIDLIKGSMQIFKCGSFHSYLYRHNTLVKFKSNSPPLGILYEVKTSPLVKQLECNDILIFMTDGYMDNPEEIIEMVLKENYNKAPSEIVNILNLKLLEKKELIDDKTLIVFKILTKRSFDIV